MPIGMTLTEIAQRHEPRRDHGADRDADADDALQQRRLRQVDEQRRSAQSTTMNCIVAPAPQNSVVVASDTCPSLSRHSSRYAVPELARSGAADCGWRSGDRRPYPESSG